MCDETLPVKSLVKFGGRGNESNCKGKFNLARGTEFLSGYQGIMEDYSWRFSEKNQHSIFFNFRFSPFFASNLHHLLTAKVMPKFK